MLAVAASFAPAAYAADEAPAELRTWLAEEGPSFVVADVNVPRLDAALVSLGEPTPVWTWSEDFLAGSSVSEPLSATTRWAAPIHVHDDAADTAVINGGIVVDLAEDSISKTTVIWTSQFGRATAAPLTLIHDVALDGWFTLSTDGVVRPVTEQALAVLAGPMQLDQLQEFIRGWNQTLDEPETHVPDAEDEPTNLVFVTALVLVGVLGLVALVVAFRKDNES